ncbi:MAG TPA: NAD(P)-dependent oxidoreductase [Candidatus Sulfomarinibacteraceae bacterium]|nr:NAD(P)-dependent oxidoreductase [Candidatus Sulfomarinibacteraceae bacterium]
MFLRDKTVFITGATGFLGSNLAQHLAQEHGARVIGSGRNLDAVAHLRRHGVNLQRADLLDLRRMRELLDGQRLVFHLAAWMGSRHGDRERAWALNVYATGKLVEMAAAAGAERFVYVSSIAAYGVSGDQIVDEDHPLSLQDNTLYGRTKAEGELQARETAQKFGLPLTIIRPGMIYGPGSRGWSLRIVRLIQKGVPVILGDGSGHAHPVYIDNLVRAMTLAAGAESAQAQVFNVVDRAVRWRDWFRHYGQMCGRQPRRLPLWLGRAGLSVAQYLPLGLAVDRDLLAYYTAKTTYSTARAESLLGYRPAVDLDEGMRRTEEWLRKEGVV